MIGYNALDIGRTITPKLTSVDSPRYAIGEKSAELLIAALKVNVPSSKSSIWAIDLLPVRVCNTSTPQMIKMKKAVHTAFFMVR